METKKARPDRPRLLLPVSSGITAPRQPSLDALPTFRMETASMHFNLGGRFGPPIQIQGIPASDRITPMSA